MFCFAMVEFNVRPVDPCWSFVAIEQNAKRADASAARGDDDHALAYPGFWAAGDTQIVQTYPISRLELDGHPVPFASGHTCQVGTASGPVLPRLAKLRPDLGAACAFLFSPFAPAF